MTRIHLRKEDFGIRCRVLRVVQKPPEYLRPARQHSQHDWRLTVVISLSCITTLRNKILETLHTATVGRQVHSSVSRSRHLRPMFV